MRVNHPYRHCHPLARCYVVPRSRSGKPNPNPPELTGETSHGVLLPAYHLLGVFFCLFFSTNLGFEMNLLRTSSPRLTVSGGVESQGLIVYLMHLCAYMYALCVCGARGNAYYLRYVYLYVCRDSTCS